MPKNWPLLLSPNALLDPQNGRFRSARNRITSKMHLNNCFHLAVSIYISLLLQGRINSFLFFNSHFDRLFNNVTCAQNFTHDLLLSCIVFSSYLWCQHLNLDKCCLPSLWKRQQGKLLVDWLQTSQSTYFFILQCFVKHTFRKTSSIQITWKRRWIGWRTTNYNAFSLHISKIFPSFGVVARHGNTR